MLRMKGSTTYTKAHVQEEEEGSIVNEYNALFDN